MIDLAPSHQILPSNAYITLKLIGACDYANIKGVDAEIRAFIVDPYPFLVINCEHLSTLSKDWIRLFLVLQNDLKKVNKAVRFILVSPQLKQVFKKEGIDSSFQFSPSLREALIDFGLVSKKALDTDFINPFLTAALHVLGVQASVNAQQGKIYLKKPGDSFHGDVSGVIGIMSENFTGSVVISFPEKTFLKIMSDMLSEDYQELSKEILDGAGEITNMIFGQAKVSLNEKGYGIKTAIPSVISGKGHTLTSISSGPTVVVPFESTAGDFFIEICLSS